MKYKAGDRVRIKSLDWYNENKDEYGNIDCGNVVFLKSMQRFCGRIVTIIDVNEVQNIYTTVLKKDYLSIENHGAEVMQLNDEMIEGLVEEEVFIKANDIYNEEYSKGEYCHEQSFKWGFQEGYNYSHENDKLEISLKEGYQFKDENGNVINATKIVLEKKKKEYPKTYEECLKVLGYDDRETYCIFHTGADERLFEALYRLKVCRDAYWKIAGEEMGLGKPWEPDWCDYTTKYCIPYSPQYKEFLKRQYDGIKHILAFPTEEMRDAFYENFKELIESVKELL